jgi:predicted RNA binding protein YcfA (HicA-like mRNA interferase family)
MPPVPSVRGDRLVRAGFKLARVAGSHHVMRHPDGRGTTVPVHPCRNVAKGTLRNILADTGPNHRETAAAPLSGPRQAQMGSAGLA